MSYILYLCFASNTLGQCLKEERVTYPTEEACRVHLSEMRFTGSFIAFAFCRPAPEPKP